MPRKNGKLGNVEILSWTLERPPSRAQKRIKHISEKSETISKIPNFMLENDICYDFSNFTREVTFPFFLTF